MTDTSESTELATLEFAAELRQRPGFTPKKEAFVQAYFETRGKPSRAYREAYDVGRDTKPSTISVSAAKLMRDDYVSGRINEIIAPQIAEAEIEAGAVIGMYLDAYQVAKVAGNSAAMTAAVSGIAKITGLDKASPEDLEDRFPILKYVIPGEAEEIVEVDDQSPEEDWIND